MGDTAEVGAGHNEQQQQVPQVTLELLHSRLETFMTGMTESMENCSAKMQQFAEGQALVTERITALERGPRSPADPVTELRRMKQRLEIVDARQKHDAELVAFAARLGENTAAKREQGVVRDMQRVLLELRLSLDALAADGVGEDDDRFAAARRAADQAWNLIRLRMRAMLYGVEKNWPAAGAYYEALLADALDVDGPRQGFDFMQDDKIGREAAKRAFEESSPTRKRNFDGAPRAPPKVPTPGRDNNANRPGGGRPKWEPNYNRPK